MRNKLALESQNLEDLSRLEWLITNGLGGYASTSVGGINTRRYHGILVASMNPPVERRILVSRVEESVTGVGGEHHLYTNQYPGTITPGGFTYIRAFTKNPLPTTTFAWEGGEMTKRISMVHGSSTTIISYSNTGATPYTLTVRPQFVDRDFHDLFFESPEYNFHTEQNAQYLKVFPKFGNTPVFMGFEGGEYHESRSWYKHIEYIREQDRGMEFQEDTYSTGYVHFALAPGETRYLVFSLNEMMLFKSAADLMAKEESRVAGIRETGHVDPWFKDLTQAGDQFLVKRKSTEGHSMIAGYHWFGDWGRDTMIALRGLAMATGRQEEAKSILRTFLRYLDQGMLPHRFPDQGEEPEYKSVDASLWLFVTLYEYAQQFEDWDFIKEVLPKIQTIIEAYIRGARFNTHVTKEGFVYAGTPNSQLTWMDAYIWGYAVTARWGCPVEINALWYNALKIYQWFCQELGEDSSLYSALIAQIEQNFKKFFWHPMGYLHDVVIPGDERDERIRPNQIFALSLPFKLLSREEGRQVFQTVRQHLYTPLGLRSLSPSDPDFKPEYIGNAWNRDTSYHMGTVWSFLLPEYLAAYLWLKDYSLESKNWVEATLVPLKKHFYSENCVEGISEIFDGKQPRWGKGTIHQAWSVGNLLHLIHKHELFGSKMPQRNTSEQVTS